MKFNTLGVYKILSNVYKLYTFK